MGNFLYPCPMEPQRPALPTAYFMSLLPLHQLWGPFILWGRPTSPASPSPPFLHVSCFVFVGFLSHLVLSCFTSYRISSLLAASSMKPSFTVQPSLMSGILSPRALVLCSLVFSCAPSSGAGGCVQGNGSSLLKLPSARDTGSICVSGSSCRGVLCVVLYVMGPSPGLRWVPSPSYGEETGHGDKTL